MQVAGEPQGGEIGEPVAGYGGGVAAAQEVQGPPGEGGVAAGSDLAVRELEQVAAGRAQLARPDR